MISEGLLKFIRRHSSLIQRKNWEFLYDKVAMSGRATLDEFSNLLAEAGYNVTEEIIPPYYYWKTNHDTVICLKDGVNKICRNAFSFCNVGTVILPFSLNKIEMSAFSHAEIRTIWFPTKEPLYLAPYAFESCLNLQEISISNNITTIGDHCFDGCSNLDTISFTGTMEEWCNIKFGIFPFAGCYSLKEISCVDGNIPLED